MLAAIKLLRRCQGWPDKAAALLLGLTLGLTLGTSVAAQNHEDAVVDQLEQRLLEEERASLPSRAVRLAPPSQLPGRASAPGSVQGHTAIAGAPLEMQGLNGVKQEMGQLQAEIDALATEVAQLQQMFLQQAHIDNVVAIDITTEQLEGAQLQSLLVRMDGQLIYEMTSDAGLWLPEKVIDLYQGPLDPGVHRLDISARAAVQHPGKIPLAQEVYRFVNKSFDLDVPTGNVRKRWRVKVQSPPGDDGQVTAELAEDTLKI